MRFCDFSIILNSNIKIEEEKTTVEEEDELDLEEEYKNYIPIEILENHHEPAVDYVRKQIIYLKTGKISIDYKLIFDGKYFDNLYLQILKEIAKIIYKNHDKIIGFMFYLNVVENIDFKMCKFFLNLHLNKKASVKQILLIFEGWDFFDKEKFMEKLKNNLKSPKYFIEENKKIEKSILSSVGVTKLLFLPTVEDFKPLSGIRDETIISQNLENFAEIYDKFREGFFNTIESFLNNQDETEINKDLRKKYICSEELKQFDVILMYFYLKIMRNKKIIEKVNENFNCELDETLPFLVKTNDKYKKNYYNNNMIIKKYGDQIKEIIDKERFNASEISDVHLISKDMLNFILEKIKI
jgi:hypothetical protein